MHIPYSGKVWWVESLVNLANCLQFAKPKSSKVTVTINNPLADLFICQNFSCQMLEIHQIFSLPNFPAIHYMLYNTCTVQETSSDD